MSRPSRASMHHTRLGRNKVSGKGGDRGAQPESRLLNGAGYTRNALPCQRLTCLERRNAFSVQLQAHDGLVHRVGSAAASLRSDQCRHHHDASAVVSTVDFTVRPLLPIPLTFLLSFVFSSAANSKMTDRLATA